MLIYLLCIIYLWYSYKVFYTRTFGSFIFIGLVLVLFFSLIFSVIIYLFTTNTYYLYIPIIPHILFTYWENKIKKRLKNDRIL
jgi:hypothetical protein